jgi:hypothetical protein
MTHHRILHPLRLLQLACSSFGSASATSGQPTRPIPPIELTTLPPIAPAPPSVSESATAIPGWHTNHNAAIGYAFDYPPAGPLSTSGESGFPTVEHPPGA